MSTTFMPADQKFITLTLATPLKPFGITLELLDNFSLSPGTEQFGDNIKKGLLTLNVIL